MPLGFRLFSLPQADFLYEVGKMAPADPDSPPTNVAALLERTGLYRHLQEKGFRRSLICPT